MTPQYNESTKLMLDLGEQSYPIIIAKRLLSSIHESFTDQVKGKKLFIIADQDVMTLFGDKLITLLNGQEGTEVAGVHTLPKGENAKLWDEVEKTMNAMLSAGIDRQSVVVAFGGGVAGDHAGFAASIVLRGIPFIQIPTTLLAMVDSSVGGKTGINSKFGKNLIGTFNQPQSVLIDLEMLKTLPATEFWAGYAEAVKYAFMFDPAFFEWLCDNAQDIAMRKAEAMTHLIKTSCEHKARIVEEDQKEHGVRALLNFGHTFAHAFEVENNFSVGLLHGEAVAIGMVLAFRLSVAMGLCPQSDAEKAEEHIRNIGLRTELGQVPSLRDKDAGIFIEHMFKDKKVRNGKIRFILSEGIGRGTIRDDVEESLLTQILEESLTYEEQANDNNDSKESA